MKYKLLRFSLMCILAMLFGGFSIAAILGTDGNELTETLTPSTQEGYAELTVTKAGTSGTGSDLEVSKGDIVVTSGLGYIKDHEMTIYKNGSMTIGFKSGVNAHITKVELTVKNYHFAKPEGWTAEYSNDVETKFTSAETETFTTEGTNIKSFTISNAAGGKTTVNVITVHYVIDSTGGGEPGGDEPGGEEPGEDEGIASPYTYTFTAKVFDAKEQSKELEGVKWALKMTCTDETGYFGYDGTKGQQFGSGNKPATALTLNTSDVPGTITSVKINTSGASSIDGTVGVTVGETALLCAEQSTVALTNTATDYEFTGSASGGITISYAQTSSKAIYIKSIEVTYSTEVEPAGFRDIKADLTSTTLIPEGAAQWTDVSTGISVATDGTLSRVDKTDGGIAFNGKWHGTQYGWAGFTATVPVDGCVKISYGNSNYGSEVTVTDDKGATVATLNNKAANTWSASNPDLVTVAYYRTNAPTTLNFSQCDYVGYFAVEAIDEADLPEEVIEYSLKYVAGEGAGQLPDTKKYAKDTEITLPANTTLYKEGYTFTGWSDGTTTYSAGTKLTMTADVTLTAQYAQNTVSLSDRTEPVTLTWQFGERNGAGTLNKEGGLNVLVTQATIGDAIIDVKMDIDATNGKINNVGRGDEWAQCNDGTKLTIPSYKGIAVSFNSYNDGTGTTIGGLTPTNKSVTYDGLDETLDIVCNGMGHIASVTAVYPVPEQDVEDENVIYSWNAGTEKGGNAEASNGTDVGAANGPYSSVIILSGKADYSTNTVTLTLANKLKVGDEIAITAYRNKNAADKQSGALLKFDKGGTATTATTGLEFVNIDSSDDSAEDSNRGSEPNTITLTVPEAADGSTVITMTRAKTQTNLFITKIVITGDRSDEPIEEPTTINVAYSIDGIECEGVLTATGGSFDSGSELTLPAKNYTLYKEGYTQTGWTDGSNDYALGAKMTLPAEDVTLKPVFTQNTVSLSDRTSDVVLKWDLEPGKMWEFNEVQNKTGILVVPATVNGLTIDVKLDYDTNNGGKLHNAGRSSWCQANKGTTFVVPSCKGATIQMLAYSAFGAEGKTATTIEGQSSYDSSTTLVYTTANKAEAIDIVLGDDASYLSYLQVTLPVVIEGGTLKEKAIIDTDFQDWAKSSTTSTVTTNFSNETITFTYSNTSVDPTATNDGKFDSTVDPAFKGYIMSGKSEATVTTSTLKNITKIRYRHGATGSNRGWGLKMKAAGDTDWTVVSDAVTGSTAWIEKDINKENVQLQWYNLNTSQNAYMFELEVYANVLVTAEQVTLATAVSPEGAGTVTVKPYAAEYDENTEVTLTAEKNFGYKFKQWTKDGEVLGTDATLAYTIAENSTVTAEFEAVDTYELKVNVDGSNDYMVEMNPLPNVIDGKMMYEAGTAVQLTANSYVGLVTFNNWSDGETSSSKLISMTDDTEVTAVYANAVDIIAGWDFYKSGNQGRIADFASEMNQTSALSLVNTDTGETSGWLDKSTEAANGYESFKGAAVNWRQGTGNGDVGHYHWQTKVNARDFTDINVQFQMLYNYNAYQTYNVEYSLNGGEWTGLGSITMTGAKAPASFSQKLPEAANNQDDLYIRMIADKTSRVDGTASANDGNALAMFFITGTQALVDDGQAPVLVSTVPADGATGVSASGKVVLTFDEKVMVSSDAAATLGSLTLTPVVSGKTISFEYKGLEYSTEYTFTLPIYTVSDLTNNAIDVPITFSFTTMERPTVDKKLYDFIVPDNGTFAEALKAAAARSDQNVRYRIFVKQGNYVIPANQSDLVTANGDHGDGNQYADPKTTFNSPNVSIIGESADNTAITNEMPNAFKDGQNVLEGIRSSGVLYLESNATDTYFQDLKLHTTTADGTGRNVILVDKGTRNVFKNVTLWAYQDTYVPDNGRGLFYFEDGIIRGRTDFICGDGDVFFNTVDIIMCADGGYITAARGNSHYGYVFKDCTIKGGTSNVNGNYYLGRPWTGGAETYFINTTMEALPRAEGWHDWGQGPTRYAEFNSMTSSGTSVDLSQRMKLFPSNNTTNNPVLTAEEAIEIGDPHNTFGDWDPTLLTEQAPVPQNVKQEGNNLVWDSSDYALLWAIVKDGSVVDFTTEPTYELTESGTYAVRAANEMGGLSEASESVEATVAEVVKVTLNASGYATLASAKALDFSGADAPKAYIVSATTDTKAMLTSVDAAPAETGLVLKGEAGAEYNIPVATSATSIEGNLLVAAVNGVTVDTKSVYVLDGDKFKVFTGTEIPAGKAYLPMNGNARLLELIFGDATAIGSVNVDVNVNQIYDMQGRRVKTPSKGVYVVDGKKVIIK